MMLEAEAEGEGSSTMFADQNERKHRLARACTARTSARLAPLAPSIERSASRNSKTSSNGIGNSNDDRNFVTILTTPPSPPHQQRWLVRNMWEFASVLNFFHVFRPVLNINTEFGAEELETALITPNDLLASIHIPMLKAIPPIIRMALRPDTWVTVMCKKLKEWWYWVAEGELPIVASHGQEFLAYRELEPSSRVIILKALCEIRVQQEDVQSHIDSSLKHGAPLSTFRRERLGGDSRGTSYWYEDDSIIGHRLYREIKKIEVKNKMKLRGSMTVPVVTCQWETIATNFEEFQDVAEKLLASRNKMEAGIGKKLKNDILPDLEVFYKRKERAIKKQQRQRMLLDGFLSNQGPSSGRSLRDRKPVTYTFDDYDRSINEAINVTKKKQPALDIRPFWPKKPSVRRSNHSANGKQNGQLEHSGATSSSLRNGSAESDAEHTPDVERTPGVLFRRERTKRRPQRYSEKEFVEAVSDNEADFDSDEEIVGEAIYDEEYLKRRKRRRQYTSSQDDEEYKEEEDNVEEEDDDYAYALSTSEEVDENEQWGQNSARIGGLKFSGAQRKEQKVKYVNEIEPGLRRSKRATRPIDYSLYEVSNSDDNAEDFEKQIVSSGQVSVSKSTSDISNSGNYEMPESDDSLEDIPGKDIDRKQNEQYDRGNTSGMGTYVDQMDFSEKELTKEENTDVKQQRFIDLNELAPLSGPDGGGTAL
eukprot:TRINITY_DN8520_c0_g2_i1.p1 TRINITY_DN8520_c0_g2~~TRINITY_DN8520_c0_g2_i1.p1  ORF type:complete len:706 (-),score=178.55 TRINITY_DN8520_c0_g2_i1:186-2303(-)